MKIIVLNVGRVRQSFIKAGEDEYLKRLRGGFQVEVQELGLEAPESMSAQQVQEREGEEVVRRIKPGEYVVVLDERGKACTSKEFSAFCAARMNSGVKSLWFVIGGAYGFSEKVRHRADYILSLSALTFPHQLTRLILIEQLYRTYTIMQGTGYHK
jgi:23S rRNA (pseudouridine1915-N3)-methyltransferase